LERLAIELDDLTPLAKRLGYTSPEELYDSVGSCDLSLERVLDELLLDKDLLPDPKTCDIEPEGLSVIGLGSLHAQFAACCKPKPGEDILGYILNTQRDVEIHRSHCPMLLAKLDRDRTRMMSVKWGLACETYPATMAIHSLDRPFLLRDVWNIISHENINVSDVQVQVNRAQDATIRISIDVADWRQFHRILVRIEDLPGVIWVRRQLALEQGPGDSQAHQLGILSPAKSTKKLRVPAFSWRFLGG
jgi:GTP pyrophosphokinase